MIKHLPRMIVGDRQSGKTQELIRCIHAIQTSGPNYKVYIIVRNKMAQEQFIKRMNKRFDSGFMKITDRPDPAKVGRSTHVFVDDHDQMSPDQLEAISAICKNSLRVIVTSTTTEHISHLAV